MNLRTTFWGGDALFEGDLSLVLRAIPAGARVTRARVTLAPARHRRQDETFHETLAVVDGAGPFGLAVQETANWAILDLGARRTVEEIKTNGLAAATGAQVQLDLGGMWVQLDNHGNLALPNPPVGNLNFPISAGGLTLPNLTAQRLKVVNLPDDPATVAVAVQEVTLLSYPSNLTLRLGNLGPFWFRTGDLRAEVTTPDFADIFQGFLDRSRPVTGVFETLFILHSDTLTRLQLVLEVEYHLVQALLAPQLSQVKLPYGYGAMPSAQPAPLKAMLPINARVLPQATSAQVVGRFDDSRVIHGQVTATTVQDTVRVDPSQSIAHPIRLSQARIANAVDLHVEAVTASATLLVTMQEDVDGKPWGSSLLPQPIEVKVERPAAGGALWVSAPLPAEFTFKADEVYWLIVNSAEGEVQWAAEPAGDLPPLQATQDAGLSWRAVRSDRLAGPVAGIYRLRARPQQFRQPIKLDVAGHLVSLGDLDGLGKVDFKLDLPGVATAFNCALDDAVQQQAHLAERVDNGDFARWTRIERKVRPVSLPLLLGADREPYGLAIAPDTGHAYFGTFTWENNYPDPNTFVAGIRMIGTEPRLYLGPSKDLIWPNNPPVSISKMELAASPDGRRVYQVVADDFFYGFLLGWEIDPQTGDLSSLVDPAAFDPTNFGPLTAGPAVDPHCRYVYAVAWEQGSGRLVRADAKTLDHNPDQDFVILRSQNGGNDQRYHTLLVAPDGARAYIASEDEGLIVDLEEWRLVGRVSLPGLALRTATLSCDGSRLYAVTEPQSQRFETPTDLTNAANLVKRTVYLLDTERLELAAEGKLHLQQTVLATIPLNQTLPPAMPAVLCAAVTPDDARLLVAVADTRKLHVIDTGTYRQLATIALPATPTHLAVTPDSRRAVLLATQNDDGLPNYGPQALAITLDAWAADGWALTGGRVAPVVVSGADKPSARLGLLTGATGLSQVFPVVGGQRYELSFRARASALGAKAELFWLSQECGLLGELAVDIEQPLCAENRPPIARIVGEGVRANRANPQNRAPTGDGGLRPHSIQGRAPEGADRAELRFKQPAGGFTLLDDVSLVTPAEATTNGDFAVVARVVSQAGQEPVQTPQGWQVTPADGTPPRLSTTPQFDGVILVTPDGRPTVLSQALEVTAGKPFILEFQAIAPGKLTARDSAAVELRWTGSQEKPLRYELILERFDVTVLDGTVPADATGAELAFIVPPGGAMGVVYAHLAQPEPIELPLTFLSEAPGELTVSALVVAYDLDDAPRPRPVAAQPAKPLGCKPTPPEDVPSAPAGPAAPVEWQFLAEPEIGYCPCCETVHFLQEPEPVVSPSGLAGISGGCPNCQAKVVVYPMR